MPLTSTQQSAYDMLLNLFQSFGLPSAPDILDVIKQSAIDGDSADIVQAKLQDTSSWKTRFAGNEMLRNKGMNVLSVQEYLAQEDQYKAILRNAGLPAGFHDDHADFVNLIGNSVSVAELQDRVNLAGDIVSREDPSVQAALSAYGMDSGMLLAYTLDPARAMPLIKRQQNAILINAAGRRSGFGVTTGQADALAERGIGESQAQQGFAQINDFYDSTKKLGDIYGDSYTADDALGEVFDGNSGEKRKRLAQQERSEFGGSSQYGVNRQSTAGRF